MSEPLTPGGIDPVGQTLQGRYRVESALGRGGMASIYLAHDLNLDKPVVIKLPHLHVLADERMRKRFIAEVRELAAQDHPYIVKIQDFGEHAGVPYAVMQFLGGGDLSQRLRAQGGRMPPDEILAWLMPIASALDSIHARGCLHRDVKPANILFDDAGHPFLSDFGIATALDMIDAEAPTLAPKDQLTSLGTFIGSPAYAPPEAVDRIFTPSYDQYGLATVVYLALSGELPFDGKTSESILIAKSNQSPSPLPREAIRRGVPVGAGRVLQRAMSKNPDDRYESCRAFAEAMARELESSRAGLGGGFSFAIAAGAISILAVVGYLMADPQSSPSAESSMTAALESGVELGSSETERAEALALCRTVDPACSPENFADERPHIYRITPTEIDRHEVTNAAFAAFIERSGRTTLAEHQGFSWDGPTRRRDVDWRRPNATTRAEQAPDLPVVHVSYDDAHAFCLAQGKRVPTADEWEYHARGSERRVFPWGDAWGPDRARTHAAAKAGGQPGPAPVGTHPAGDTPEGIADLAGNVWEWTSSPGGDGLIIKGASWDYGNPAFFRGAAFATSPATNTSSDLGFRCIRDL